MRVAIIGGGLSGLACAHELERLGISPVIYEQRSFIGEPYRHVTATLEISHRPIRDAVKYFKNKLDIDIQPLDELKTIIHHSPNKIAVVKGNLGYLFKNTNDCDSIKNQLFEKLKNTEIRLNEQGDYENLSREYDWVVVATGNFSISQILGVWQEWFQGFIRGAVVHGDFDPQTLIMWLNKDYLKNGYAYLTPFNNRKASLVLIVTDVNEKEVDHYWELFLDAENIKYTLSEEFKQDHRSGYVYPLIVNNIIFVGNAIGGLDPFLGFGYLNAFVSGVSAARTIANGANYEKQMKDILKRNLDMRQFRKVYNSLTNKGLDNVVAGMNIPGLRYLLYSFPLNINVASIGAVATKLFFKNEKLGK